MNTTGQLLSVSRPGAELRVPSIWIATFVVAMEMMIAPGGALAQRPLGVDVSSYQGSINWSSAKGAGITFAWAKATEGTGYIDGYFTANQNNGKNAGVYMGAYHFPHPELNTPAAEAAYFWNVAGGYVKADGKTLMPMIDIEGNAFTGNVGASSISDWVNQWCNAVVNDAASAGVKVKPVIYVSACNAGHFNSTVAQWYPWIADWNGASSQSGTPWSVCSGDDVWGTWVVWQYTDAASVSGISGSVDGDVFNGSTSGLVSTLVPASSSFNNAAYVSSSVPGSVLTGATFTATITLNNNGTIAWTSGGSNPYHLGSQSPQDNTTWGFGRVNLPSSPINAGQNATFTFTATAPMTGGSYTFAWQMVQEGVQWFGDTFSTTISVLHPGATDIGSLGSYTINTVMDPSSAANYASFGSCGDTCWYSYVCNTAGTQFDRPIFWLPGQPAYGCTGRMWIYGAVVIPSTLSEATVYLHASNSGGGDIGYSSPAINECAYSCNNLLINSTTVNLGGTSFGGWLGNTSFDSAGAGCNTSCGYYAAGYGPVTVQAARWQYIDDWTCLGPFNSTGIEDNAAGGRSFPFGEAGLYFYPALDTSHGNAISAGLGFGVGTSAVTSSGNGSTAAVAVGEVLTGDGNNANVLNYGGSVGGVSPAGNAAAYGNANNADAYACAWIYSPGGAGPRLAIGGDDYTKLWINGTLVSDNQTTCCGYDSFISSSGVGIGAGWSRVLLKVHNGGGGWTGMVSFRNGGNNNLNEPSLDYFDCGGYYSYGIGYEQDAWYPTISPTNFYGSAPVNAAAYYGNNTTVTIGGTSGINSGSPVPYWRTMQYQWGYGISGDSNYADVSGTPTGTSWSHTETGVIGHRRFQLFAVSQSGRTSFQNSGASGGWTWSDSGNYGRYYDIFVDNVAPVSPSFSSVAAASTSQINLAWVIPLDQGVNIMNSATEATTGLTSGGANGYIVGDVGCQVYRDGAVVAGWGSGTGLSDTGLVANTSYAYTIEARDNNSGGRGIWNNTTGPQGTNTAWTLSVAPVAGSITPDNASPTYGSTTMWTAVNGFGAGQVQYYRYAWDQSATHAWTDSETQWSSGPLATVTASAGAWYLHVKGYNGAAVGNGTFDYSVNAVLPPSTTTLASSANPSVYGAPVTFTATVGSTAGTPTGNVVFLADAVPFSTNALVGGVISASTTSLPVGTNTVAAQYAGESNFLGSTGTVQQVVQSGVVYSQTNVVSAMVDNGDGTFTLSFVGTPQAQYYVVRCADPARLTSGWELLPNSTNTAPPPDGVWSVTVTNDASQRFYRSAAVNPAP